MSQQRKCAPQNAAKKIIFNAFTLADHLGALKRASIADGAEEGFAYWKNVLDFEFTSVRKGGNGTQWVSVYYTDVNGVRGRPIVRINGEKQNGLMMPGTDAGVAELVASLKNPNTKVEKRTKKPSIQIQKYSVPVKTAEDGLTVLSDADGQPILPGDEYLSDYYRVANLINEAFVAETRKRIDAGTFLMSKTNEMKRADKATTAQMVDEAVTAAIGPRRVGDMILSSEMVSTIRKHFPTQKDIDFLTKSAIITSNVKVVSLIQEYISDQAKKNAGLMLPNFMTRAAMNFNSTTGVAEFAIFDKGAPFMVEGKQKYEVGRVDGDPVNSDNIHKFVVSRATLDGIINLDSICFSNMGISMPAKVEVLVVGKPTTTQEVGFDDVYDDAGGYAHQSSVCWPGSAEEQPPPAKKPDASETYVDSLHGLLDELGGDQAA
jgi:hypothetical protein